MNNVVNSSAPSKIRRFFRPLLIAGAVCIATSTLSACSGNEWGFPWRAPQQQGNWLTKDQVSLLQKGMTEQQVLYALGSPTLRDIFHPDRWDYPYYFIPGNGEVVQRNFSVWFVDGKLDRWGGDEMPDYQPADYYTQQSSGKDKERIERSNNSANIPGSVTSITPASDDDDKGPTKAELEAQAVKVPQNRNEALYGPVGDSPAAIAPDDENANRRRLPSNINIQEPSSSNKAPGTFGGQRQHGGLNTFPDR